MRVEQIDSGSEGEFTFAPLPEDSRGANGIYKGKVEAFLATGEVSALCNGVKKNSRGSIAGVCKDIRAKGIEVYVCSRKGSQVWLTIERPKNFKGF
jgi:hypothetical protein